MIKSFFHNFFAILFGDVGTIVISIVTMLLSFILFPIFMQVVYSDMIFHGLLAFLMGIFAIGFLISSLGSCVALIIKGAFKKIKWQRWTMIGIGAGVIVLDAVAVIVGIVVA